MQLHDSEGTLSGLVLIREFRAGSGAVERPPLQPAALLGEWQGQASTINADWPEPEVAAAALQVQAGAAGELSLQITLGTRREPAEGRLLLLPDGGFHLTPLTVSHRRPFSVQAGWMASPDACSA